MRRSVIRRTTTLAGWLLLGSLAGCGLPEPRPDEPHALVIFVGCDGASATFDNTVLFDEDDAARSQRAAVIRRLEPESYSIWVQVGEGEGARGTFVTDRYQSDGERWVLRVSPERYDFYSIGERLFRLAKGAHSPPPAGAPCAELVLVNESDAPAEASILLDERAVCLRERLAPSERRVFRVTPGRYRARVERGPVGHRDEEVELVAARRFTYHFRPTQDPYADPAIDTSFGGSMEDLLRAPR